VNVIQPLTLNEAIEQILQEIPAPGGTETVALADLGGRVAARDITAPVDLPPFPSSAMDGYAIDGQSGAHQFEIIGTSLAGHPFEAPVGAGQCVRITTGAALPDGTDTVAIQENCTRTGDRLTLNEPWCSTFLAYETGVPNTIDPLAGSYYLEALTDELEAEAEAIFQEIDDIGGVVDGIEAGYFQAQIAAAARRFQEEVENGQQTIVGVNRFVESDEPPLEILKIGEEAASKQESRLASLRARRDNETCEAALERLTAAAVADENVMPPMLDAVRAYATLGEIRIALEKVYGRFKEPVAF